MKKRTILTALITASLLIFTACEKDDDASSKPTIGEMELGIGNSHVAYIGANLHVETEIVAEGLISMILVEIHAEDGSDNEIEVEYDYSDKILKNTTFHEHVNIPSEFLAGEYHFHLTVTDKEGNSTSVEDDIELEELLDEEAPVITITSAPTDGQGFNNDDTISISGTVTDNLALEGLVVALVYADDNIADADVSGDNSKVVVMLHTHDFEDPDEAAFTASIKVGAENDNNMTPASIGGDNAWKSGNYYILVKSKDAKLNGSISEHYPIEINL